MKKNITLILIIFTTVNIYLYMPFIMAYIEQHYNLEWTKNTGPLGDTFGGLLSPIIGLVSVYFIYESIPEPRGRHNRQ